MPRFLEALGNDLNMAGAIGILNEAAGEVPVDAAATGNGDGQWSEDLKALRLMDHVLGVLELDTEAVDSSGDLDVDWIEEKIQSRITAREGKDWSEADRIRDQLLEKGIEIKDGPEGTTWKRVVR